MGFKLGTERGNYAVSGEIRTKMRFHQEAGGDASVPGTPVVRVPLEEGVLGEANMDGSIYINEQIIPNSFEERQVVSHEMRHATDIKIGKLAQPLRVAITGKNVSPGIYDTVRLLGREKTLKRLNNAIEFIESLGIS